MSINMSRYRFPLISAALLAAFAFSPGAGAASPEKATIEASAGESMTVTGAKAFIDRAANETVAFLADPSLPEDQKNQQFRSLLFANFDMDTIGRFVLGTYWNAASPAQRTEYLGLFRELIARVWATRFKNYNGQSFAIRGARADSEKDTIVSSVIIPPAGSGSEVHVDWRVRFKDGQYKIVDVIVEGVSLSVTQRSDFASVIQRGGGNVQALIDNMRRQTR